MDNGTDSSMIMQIFLKKWPQEVRNIHGTYHKHYQNNG